MNEFEINVENVVASVDLFTKIPLEKAAQILPNVYYYPEQFPGLVLRISQPKISALLFSSGKIVVTGAKSIDQIYQAIEAIKKELEKLDVKVTAKPEVEVQNMVASGNLFLTLNLNDLAFKLENAEYEPEQFPGLVYKVPNSHITFLLFSTGKIVCTGAKNEEEIIEAVKKLREKLKKLKEEE